MPEQFNQPNLPEAAAHNTPVEMDHHHNLFHDLSQVVNYATEHLSHGAEKATSTVKEVTQQAMDGISSVVSNPTQIVEQTSAQIKEATDQLEEQVNQFTQHPTKLVDMGVNMAGGMGGTAVGEIVGASTGAVLGPVGMIVGAEAGSLLGSVIGVQKAGYFAHQVLHPKEEEDPSEVSKFTDVLQAKGAEKVGQTLGESTGVILASALLGSTGEKLGKMVGGHMGGLVGQVGAKHIPVYEHHPHSEPENLSTPDSATLT